MRIDWKFKIMLEQTSGANFNGINKKTQRRNSKLEIMFCGFPREKKHIGQVQEKMVWSIQGTILLTQ
jgi:hypothetical protein